MKRINWISVLMIVGNIFCFFVCQIPAVKALLVFASVILAMDLIC
jgi:hypothetical protein